MSELSIKLINIAVISLYILFTIVIGVVSARKSKTTEDYFLGGRSFPGWAIGLSMVGTSISAVTFLAFPAAAYSLDWRMLVPNLLMPVGVIFAIFVFIPFFRRGRITSVYEYLESRYGAIVRLYGALTFLVGQIVRLGIILYLVSIAIASLLHVDVVWAVVLGGIFVTFYTVVGGISAVIWTDVVQTLVLMVGGVICFAFIWFKLPGGGGQIFEVAAEYNKFGLGDAQWNLGERTMYTMIIMGLIGWVQSHACNQNVVQRYLSASSVREARKATIISCVFSLANWGFFFLIGTALFVFYKLLPDPAVAEMGNDQVFPYFIVTQLPAGISGLIIAAASAAAMSSLDSSMNTISLTVSIDVFQRFLMKNRSDRFYLVLAKIVTLVSGVFMIGTAVLFHLLPRESLLDALNIVGSLVTGPVLALFMLGFFTTRVDNRVILMTLGLAIPFHIYLVLNFLGVLPDAVSCSLHAYWIHPVLDSAAFAIAMVISLFLPGSKTGLEGLTVWTVTRRAD